MDNILVVSPIFIVIFCNFLSCESRAVVKVDPYEYIWSKRGENDIERRSFLQSFCASRCNIGKGGNVCRCNGFHFAGKRTSYLPEQKEHFPAEDKSSVNSDEDVYKLLEGNNKIVLQPNGYSHQHEAMGENSMLQEILDVLPEIISEDTDIGRSPNRGFRRVLEDIYRTDDI